MSIPIERQVIGYVVALDSRVSFDYILNIGQVEKYWGGGPPSVVLNPFLFYFTLIASSFEQLKLCSLRFDCQMNHHGIKLRYNETEAECISTNRRSVLLTHVWDWSDIQAIPFRMQCTFLSKTMSMLDSRLKHKSAWARK